MAALDARPPASLFRQRAWRVMATSAQAWRLVAPSPARVVRRRPGTRLDGRLAHWHTGWPAWAP